MDVVHGCKHIRNKYIYGSQVHMLTSMTHMDVGMLAMDVSISNVHGYGVWMWCMDVMHGCGAWMLCMDVVHGCMHIRNKYIYGSQVHMLTSMTHMDVRMWTMDFCISKCIHPCFTGSHADKHNTHGCKHVGNGC